MSLSANRAVARLMDGLDLVIEFATLGEYGLEELPADGPRREGTGRRCDAPLTPRGAPPTGWEALAPPRRSSSEVSARRTTRDVRVAAGSLV